MTRWAASSPKLRIALCHPDLGIGGAERLVVDAAMELKKRGHEVLIFTAHHDRQHCFEETLGGDLPVVVYGDFLPRSIFNRLHAVCAYIRCLYVAFCMVLFWHTFDVVFVDQVSAVIPVFRMKSSSKILFYCHFPDMLLAQHTTTLRKLYRKPLDWLEETTTGKADLVLVNSEFTASTFAETFKTLNKYGMRPSVLYPAVDIDQFYTQKKPCTNGPFFLSINRFERKKNIGLAISSFAAVRRELATVRVDEKCEIAASVDVRLVIAGGYDDRLAENREYLQELKTLVSDEGISGFVDFEPSCSTARKNELLASCIAVIYTPMKEHFGIVPLEAMGAAKPVIACNSGGPKESVEHSVTGFLCENSARSFASAMLVFFREPSRAELMGVAARKHVETKFSRTVFGENLNNYISELLISSRRSAKQGIEMSRI
ncbi:alpha-1,3/alpha-1,6-mannosyltransferase [Marchantia polymorpha subsp. ruderalis]